MEGFALGLDRVGRREQIGRADRLTGSQEQTAQAFGCAKSAVTIKTGAGSKLKRVVVPD